MSQIVEKSSQIGQEGELELERGRRRVGRGARVGWGAGEEGKVSVAHLYRATTRVGTNVLTFVPGGGSDRYKCTSLTFVSGGWEMAPTRPCKKAFVLVGASNRYRCSYLYRDYKYPVQIKNRSRIYVRFSSSGKITCVTVSSTMPHTSHVASCTTSFSRRFVRHWLTRDQGLRQNLPAS
jgi:hypothetical protein